MIYTSFLLKILFIYLSVIFSSCSRSTMHDSINMNWKVNSKNKNFNIVLYEGYNPDVPLRAWAVLIPSNNKLEILVSNDDDGLETPSEIALNRNASVVINGGYFARGQKPMRHIGLLKSKNILIEPASNSVFRENIRYNINRGAFGILKDNSIDISWASTRNDSIFSWSFPFQNRPGKPASVNYNFSEFWDVKEAIHAGPVLIRNGKINLSTEQEVFFNTPVDGVQPRSAIGYKKNGDIIMMVVDGRQVDSRGVYLKELAMLMSQFDCEEALNLDGGGSSALVINGNLVNSPIGLKSERQVMSFIAVINSK
tara:strand:+ start:834 stop:1766 length:933 start_codon:yes stop_codon:yes gene_type:complete